MDRAALAAFLLVAALYAAGCGGDEDGNPSSKGPDAAGDRAVTPPPARDSSPRPENHGHDEEPSDGHEGDGLEQRPRPERVRSVRLASVSIAGLNGLLKARVTVSAGGKRVAISVPPNVACTVTPGAATKTANEIKRALRIVKYVSVMVGGRSFAAHRPNCRAPELPGGTGRVVYTRRAIGNAESAEFKITAKRWTIAYRNDSGFFSVFVFKDGKAQNDVITTTKASSAKKTFRGPGTFKLKISGGSPWAVTVRDGA